VCGYLNSLLGVYFKMNIKETKKKIIKALKEDTKNCPFCSGNDTYAVNRVLNFRCNNCGEYFD